MPSFNFKGSATTGRGRGRPKGSTNKKKLIPFPKSGTTLFNKKVKKVIQRQAEKKSQINTQSLTFGTYTSTSVGNQIIPVTPYDSVGITIPQGAPSGSRIGNSIRTVRQTITGVITPLPYNLTLNPFPKPLEFRVWFFSLRNSNTRPTTLADFFQQGSTSSAPQGNLLDLVYKINTDVYIYRGHRSYKLGYANYDGTGQDLPSQSFANNDFKYNIRFTWDVTKMVPKIVKFNDNTNTATSKQVFMFFEVVNADGTVQQFSQLSASMYFQNSLTYTDL